MGQQNSYTEDRLEERGKKVGDYTISARHGSILLLSHFRLQLENSLVGSK